ncbi:GTP cyclohydrolase 1 type 2 [Buchnera aphidicola (Pterocallis alni)]|uniref:Nif3-like dinuclear metal center hexameric protein n=1 Tax=Buchnera aphidicola TaxID=9 RepID=UPI0034648E65
MNNYQLEHIINNKLKSKYIKDIIPNGMQIEGSSNITKIITGVSICQKLIDISIFHQAQAIIVHHGFFWMNEQQNIIQNKRKRLKSILYNNINVYNWHLPLDIHPQLGNNAQIAKKLNIKILGHDSSIVSWGKLKKPKTVKKFFNKIELIFNRKPVCFQHSKNNIIKNIAWCSGKGQKFINIAHKLKMDAFLTGEISEEVMHYAYENHIHFFSIGHYVSEKFGIQALGEWIEKKLNINTKFIDIHNPI